MNHMTYFISEGDVTWAGFKSMFIYVCELFNLYF